MGCGSTNDNKQEPKNIPKKAETKQESIPKEIDNEPGDYYYCLREKEISCIEEMKEKKIILKIL